MAASTFVVPSLAGGLSSDGQPRGAGILGHDLAASSVLVVPCSTEVCDDVAAPPGVANSAGGERADGQREAQRDADNAALRCSL